MPVPSPSPHTFWGWLGGLGVSLHSSPPPFFCRFPSDLLLTSSSGELWRMVRIGGQPLGFGERGRRARPLPRGGAGVWAPSPSSQHPSRHPPAWEPSLLLPLRPLPVLSFGVPCHLVAPRRGDTGVTAGHVASPR